MTLFEWIEKAGQLGVDGLEMHDLFFEGRGKNSWTRCEGSATEYNLAIPMMCFSPDFTHPDPRSGEEELEKQKNAIDLTVKLGGKFCRTLSGQNRPAWTEKSAAAGAWK